MTDPFTDDLGRAPPQTEDAAGRGFVRDGQGNAGEGESVELDPPRR